MTIREIELDNFRIYKGRIGLNFFQMGIKI